jgi:NAD dependent epimerase/dehydratase family enzyme
MVFGPGRGGVGEAFGQIVKQRLAGSAGSGKQYVSWIHLQDFLRALQFIIEHEEMEGAINLAAPDPRPNHEFMRILRQRMKVGLGLPAPEWLLELGAIFKRTETELLLKSRRVWPARLLQAGFKFQFENWQSVPLDS